MKYDNLKTMLAKTDTQIDEGLKTSLLSSLLGTVLATSAVEVGAAKVGSDQKTETVDTNNKFKGYTQDDIDVARVIFSEAGPSCPFEERQLVATVMKNRMNHKAFGSGKLKTMKQVAYQPKAFSSVNDVKNSNWKLSGKLNRKEFNGIDARTIKAWNESLELAAGKNLLADKNVVFFIDNTLKNPPKDWYKYYDPKLVSMTKNFKFYEIKEKV